VALEKRKRGRVMEIKGKKIEKNKIKKLKR